MDSRPTTFWGRGPVAGHITYNRLQGREKGFLSKLEEKGYFPKESQIFYTILSTPKNIFFKPSESEEADFPEAVLHERVYREISRLNYEDQVKIHLAWEKLKKRTPPAGYDLFLDDKPKYAGFVAMAVDLNWKEFFPNLAQGTLEEHVEETLKQEFPEACDLFLEVKDRAKVECAE